MRFRIKRFVSSLFFPLAIFASLCSAKGSETDDRAVATYAPKPGYPVLPNGKLPEGSGMFILRIDPKTGLVKYVSVEKSTGSPLLDKSSIDCLKRWRFMPNPRLSRVKVPFTYTAHGIPTDWKIVPDS